MKFTFAASATVVALTLSQEAAAYGVQPVRDTDDLGSWPLIKPVYNFRPPRPGSMGSMLADTDDLGSSHFVQPVYNLNHRLGWFHRPGSMGSMLADTDDLGSWPLIKPVYNFRPPRPGSMGSMLADDDDDLGLAIPGSRSPVLQQVIPRLLQQRKPSLFEDQHDDLGRSGGWNDGSVFNDEDDFLGAVVYGNGRPTSWEQARRFQSWNGQPGPRI